MANSAKSNIVLYTASTPNGVKISITLEELGLPYDVKSLAFSKNEQKEPKFLEINPNGRIPAITDTFTDGKEIRVFESGSIMEYLVDRYDIHHAISYPRNSREHVEMINWLYFQNAGVGPMQGQANHFYRYAPEKIEYGIKRYQNETRRLYRTIDQHLKSAGTPYIVGNKCTLADIAHIGWIASAEYAGVDISEFETLSKWRENMLSRPGVKKGRDVPTKQSEKASDEKQAADHADWIQQGMKNDAKQ